MSSGPSEPLLGRTGGPEPAAAAYVKEGKRLLLIAGPVALQSAMGFSANLVRPVCLRTVHACSQQAMPLQLLVRARMQCGQTEGCLTWLRPCSALP